MTHQGVASKTTNLLMAIVITVAGLLGISVVAAGSAHAGTIGGPPSGGGGGGTGGSFPCDGCSGGGSGRPGGGWSQPLNGIAAWYGNARYADTFNGRGLPQPLGTYRYLTLGSNGWNAGDWMDQQYRSYRSPCQAPDKYSVVNTSTIPTVVKDASGAFPSNAIGIRWTQNKNWNSDSSVLMESNLIPGACLHPAAPAITWRRCPVKVESIAWRGPYGNLVNTTNPTGAAVVVPASAQPWNNIPAGNGETGWFYQTGKEPSNANSRFAYLYNSGQWRPKVVTTPAQAWNLINTCGGIYAEFRFSPSDQPANSASATTKYGKSPIGLVGNYDYKANYKFVTCYKISDAAYTAQVTNGNYTTAPYTWLPKERFPAGSIWGCGSKALAEEKIQGVQSMGYCTSNNPANDSLYKNGTPILPPTQGFLNGKVGTTTYEKAISPRQVKVTNFNNVWWKGATGKGCGNPPPPCTTNCSSTNPDEGSTTKYVTGFCAYTPGTTAPSILNGTQPVKDNAQIVAQGQKVSVSWAAKPIFSPDARNVREVEATFNVDDNGAYPELSDGQDPSDPIRATFPLDGSQVADTNTIALNFYRGSALDSSDINAKDVAPLPLKLSMTRTFTYDAVTTKQTFKVINGVTTIVTTTETLTPMTGSCPPLTADITAVETRNTN